MPDGRTHTPPSAHAQLTIDGGEVTHEAVKRTVRPPALGLNQRAAIEVARYHGGTIRPVQAGVAAHNRRGYCGFGAKSGRFGGSGLACCPYASSDGNEIVKSLRARGILERLEGGLYVLVGA